LATPDEQAQSMFRNLTENTGKTVEEWLVLVGSSGLVKHGEIVKMLKSEYKVTHGYANLIAHEKRSSAAMHANPADLISGQYRSKEQLRPIYDLLREAVMGFGKDVEIAPKKTYVSLRRAKQFGLIQPSTKTRVDVGIQLKGVSPTDRLEASGGFNAMVSHRVRVAETEDVDDELVAWLRAAYEAAE